MQDVVIAGYARSAFHFAGKGALARVRPDDLAAAVVRGLVARSGVDVAVKDAFTASKEGTWKPGITVLGLKEDGVGYAEDQYNKALLTPDMVKAVKAAATDIESGKLVVHDYMEDNKCPG